MIPYPAGNPKRGTTKKSDYEYLTTLKKLTESSAHPRNQGVTMQAHHVISAKSVVLAGLKDRLEDFGYDINVANNLVFIPSTLQGACLLQVQPHRGDHSAVDAADIDGNRDDTYHEKVRDRLKKVLPKLERECGKPGVDMKKFVHLKLDELRKR